MICIIYFPPKNNLEVGKLGCLDNLLGSQYAHINTI